MAKIGRKLPFLVFLGIKTAKKIHKNNFWSQVQIFLAPTPLKPLFWLGHPAPGPAYANKGSSY